MKISKTTALGWIALWADHHMDDISWAKCAKYSLPNGSTHDKTASDPKGVFVGGEARCAQTDRVGGVQGLRTRSEIVRCGFQVSVSGGETWQFLDGQPKRP